MIKYSVSMLMFIIVIFNMFFLLFSSTVTAEYPTYKTNLQKPVSTTKSFFKVNYKQKRYPLKLFWSDVPGADAFEVEITRVKTCSRRYFEAYQNKFDIVIYPNAKYYWRVRGFSDGKLITDFSPSYQLYLKAPVIENLQTKYYGFEDSFDDIEGNDASTLCEISEESNHQGLDDKLKSYEKLTDPIVVKNQDLLLWDNTWVSSGISMNSYIVKQEFINTEGVEFGLHSGPALHIEFGKFLTSNLGLYIQAIMSGPVNNDEFQEKNNLVKARQQTKSLIFQGFYTLGSSWDTINKSQWHLLFGVSYDERPLAKLIENNNFELVNLKTISLITGVGYKFKLSRKVRTGLNVFMAYSLMTEAGEIQLKHDVALGFGLHGNLNYSISKDLLVGLSLKSINSYVKYKGPFDLIYGESFLSLNNYLGLEFTYEL